MASFSPEIEMVWPVCLAVGAGNRHCSIDVMLDGEHRLSSSCNPDDCMLLLATGSAMDLVASTTIREDGSAHCR
jgi:hypothetical protein